MENKRTLEMIEEKILPALEKQGYSRAAGENDGASVVYSTDKRAVRVRFDEQEKQYVLETGEVEDGEVSADWRGLSRWLYDPETSTDNDVRSIANDFEDSILGLERRQEVARRTPVTARKKMNESDFIEQFVKQYPQYEGDKAANEQRYGDLLPDTFVDTVAAEYMMEMLRGRKNAFLKKLFVFLDEGYAKGDDNVKSMITVTLFRHLLQDEQAEETAIGYMGDILKRSWKNMRKILVKKGSALAF